jgi:hypothetical protein
LGITVERFLDLAEERAADNASTTPHECDATIVQVPAVLLGRLAHEHVPLGVADDLGGEERLAGVLHNSLPVALDRTVGSTDDLGGLDPFGLQSREATGIHGFDNQCHRHTEIQ